MISAFEITGIILLAIGVGLVVWWYIEASKYDSMLDGVPFAKGANLIYNANGSDSDNTITMSCPEGKNVCVYQATQIYTKPDPSTNTENADTDPIYAGLDKNWGKFNPHTTIDLTAELNSNCGTGVGEAVTKGSCSYVVTSKLGQPTTDGSGIFGGDSNGGEEHFIATYTCQPATLSDGTTGTCNPATIWTG
jgi:hypothetical protein